MQLRAILVSLALASSAAAQQPTEMVRFGDLDLSRAEGVAELDRRLEGAARKLCPNFDRPDRDYMSVMRCRQQALQGAESRRMAAIAAATQRSQIQLAGH